MSPRWRVGLVGKPLSSVRVVGKIASKLRKWWGRRPGTSAAPYQVVCACGSVARGLRRRRHQVVRCGHCGEPLFVLATSPLPSPSGERPSAPRPSSSAAVVRKARSPWRWPLAAALLTLATAVGVYAVLFLALYRPASPAPGDVADAPALLREGKQALAGQRFKLAEARLAQALAGQKGLPPEDRRRLPQLHRQAALLADLLDVSLGELLHTANGLAGAEWQAQFRERYQNKSVVFDAEVRRLADGRYRLDYEVRAGLELARIDLDGLRLLRELPLETPRRLVFGARLEEVVREQPGLWVVRPAADSGVLLTDSGAAAACCPALRGDEAEELLRRQEGWVAGP